MTAVADLFFKFLTGFRAKLRSVETGPVRLLAERLRRRRTALAVVIGLVGALWLGGQVSLLALIVLGSGALAAAALFSPRPNAWTGEPGALAPDAEVAEAAALTAAPSGPAPAEIAAQVWRTAVEAFPEPVLLVDGTGLLVRANTAVLDIFPKAAAGVPVSSVTRNPELLEAIDEVRRSGRRLIVALHDRVPIRRKLLAVVTPLAGTADPSDPSVVVVIRDVSEEERLAQMRADFIANASHELRTPLASLRGFVETLQGPARNDEKARERFLDIMAGQAALMTRLIDDLLSLSRIEMRAHVQPRGEVELNEVAGFVAQSLEPVAQGLGVNIHLEAAASPMLVRGDRDELVQVVTNLVHNAIKYGKEGGHIVIRSSDEPGHGAGRPQVSLAISDDGPGIAAEHLPRLTERFYRVNAAVSREKGGTGLGLAIVKNIVNRHRGELRIESEVGRGSTFTIVLDRLKGPVRGGHLSILPMQIN